jgi:hypothetical protein
VKRQIEEVEDRLRTLRLEGVGRTEVIQTNLLLDYVQQELAQMIIFLCCLDRLCHHFLH